MEATRGALRAAADDRERLSALLDPVAAEAAAGSKAQLEVLLWAVDELRLADFVIRRLVLDESDVEDVAQDVLVAVAETIGAFRGEARFTTWLNEVARFKAIAHLRRKRDEARLDDDVEPADAARISSMLANGVVLQELLDELPGHYRDAVVLRDVEQLPYDEMPAGSTSTRTPPRAASPGAAPWSRHGSGALTALTAPARIGRYRVQEIVGVGGFATVYRALDERLGVDVAVKVLAEKLDEALGHLSPEEIASLDSQGIVDAAVANPVERPESAPYDFRENAIPELPDLATFRIFTREVAILQMHDGQYDVLSDDFVDILEPPDLS